MKIVRTAEYAEGYVLKFSEGSAGFFQSAGGQNWSLQGVAQANVDSKGGEIATHTHECARFVGDEGKAASAYSGSLFNHVPSTSRY